MPDRYCIRDGYEARGMAATIEGDFGDYWDEARIAKSMDYQWDVYAAARQLADRHGLVSVADLGCGVATKLDHFFGQQRPVGFDQATTGGHIRKRFPRVRFRAIDLEQPEAAVSLDERFDLTICCDVIEHLLDPDPLMELLRTRTERFVVLSTPERDITRGPGAMRSEKPEHVREWNREEFGTYVRTRGFSVVEHRLVPKERLGTEEWAEREASRERTRRWHGCQLVIATPV
jgi:hypothetical protein